MPTLHRPTLLAAAATLAAPAIVRAAAASTLRFVPVIDLAFTDPIFAAAAQVSRTHGLMVFDMLYGMDTNLDVSPQMLEGARTEDDGKLWELRLRPGLLWHDGTPVLARDCTASIRRWAARDGMGTALLDATDELSAPDDRTIRFRLKRPFPLLPYALGKVAVPTCFMMPERLALTDPFKPIPEVIGSGPFHYKADERLAGARNVYSGSTATCRGRARRPIGPAAPRSSISTAWNGQPCRMPAPRSPPCKPASRTGWRTRRTTCCP